MAQELAGVKTQYLVADEDVGLDMRTKLLDPVMEPTEKKLPLRLLKEFRPLDDGSRFAGAFKDYLIDERGYRPKQVQWLTETYDLHYATRGSFAYRVIMPLRDRWGKLLTWTARSIIKDEEVRYKTLSVTAKPWLGLPAAACATTETLFGLDVLWDCPNPKACIICEGPFDATWISTFGHSLGVYGTCVFGLNLTPTQSVLIEDLRDRFDYIGMLLDGAAHFQAFRLANNGLNLDLLKIPDGVKDPAVLSPNAVMDLCLSVVK